MKVTIHYPDEKAECTDEFIVLNEKGIIEYLDSNNLTYTTSKEDGQTHIHLEEGPSTNENVAWVLFWAKEDAEEFAAYKACFEEQLDGSQSEEEYEDETEDREYDAEADGDEWPETGPWARN